MDPLLGGALIGAGGNLLGGLLGSDGASDAAAAQMRMFREGQNANSANFLTQLGLGEPWRAGGASALNQLLGMFGLPQQGYQSGVDIARQNMAAGQSANNRMGADAIIKLMKQGKSIQEISQLGMLKSKSSVVKRLSKKGLSAADISTLQQGPVFNQPSAAPSAAGAAPGSPQYPPGYNFFREEGQRGLENSAAARGGAFSGNALRGLADFNQNYASQNMINPLFRLAGFGSEATGNAQQAAGNYGQNTMQNYNNMGDARASGIANQANIWGNALSGIGQAAGYAYGNRRPTGQQAYDDYQYYGNQHPQGYAGRGY